MKRNEINGDLEFEKVLRDKMNELSASVDCFDKISARAFPEKTEDFSDSGSTVTDLENISGKRRKSPVLKWVAAAAAAVLVVGVLPRTALMNTLMSNLGSGNRKIYNELLSEISEAVSGSDYKVYDLPLSEYIAGDVLVTPLYSCPFRDSGKSDINVRIYVRMCGNVPTNQIYAVEYTGTYTESNIIAAAASKAKFTDEEIVELIESGTGWSHDETALINAAEYNFGSTKQNKLDMALDYNGEEVSAASFTYVCYFKDGETIQPLVSDVLYYHYGADESNEYYYDIFTSVSGGKDGGAATIPDDLWETSVSYDGKPAKPESSQSDFTRVELFGNVPEQDLVCGYMWAFYGLNDKAGSGVENIIADLQDNTAWRTISTVYTPFDTAVRSTMRIYFDPFYLSVYDGNDPPNFRLHTDETDLMTDSGVYYTYFGDGVKFRSYDSYDPDEIKAMLETERRILEEREREIEESNSDRQ